ncbi:ERI1 exoribonuclease 2 [Menidia menidia]
MSTKELAIKLGLLRQRSQSSGSKKSLVSNQLFSYLIVIDFESTCWREKNNSSQEIIEFPAVLLNTSTGEIESEFHTYVQPQEHPVLSEFCTELTGIVQEQVEAGIPLQICLSRFNRWLQNLQLRMGVAFPNRQQASSSTPAVSQKLCTFLTWSDWDLGVCLQYECKRKQLHKPGVLNSWIDLRSTYRLFYDRKPKGLSGALQDLGIQFSGREHSGLDDARNTAQLAARMMRDGCVMKITRSLERPTVMVKPPSGSNRPAKNEKEKLNIQEKENVTSISKHCPSKTTLETIQKLSYQEHTTRNGGSKGSSDMSNGQTCLSLISPTTLLSVAPLGRHSCRPVTTQAANLSSTARMDAPQSNSSHVLCSTTVSCFSNLPQPDQGPGAGQEERAELLVETEERCGSYDDVLLGADDDMNATGRECDPEYISDFDSGCYEWEESDDSHSPARPFADEDGMRETVAAGRRSEWQNMTSGSSVLCKSIKTSNYTVRHSKEILQPRTSLNSDTCFAVPKPVNWNKSNHSKSGFKASSDIQIQLKGSHVGYKTKMPSPVRLKPFAPGKTSTPNASSVRPKPIATKHSKPPFPIFSEPAGQAVGASRPPHTPNNALSSLSVNALPSGAGHLGLPATARGPQRITAPLCLCGRRAKRQAVSNGGPNHGRGFYCCPVRRSGPTGRVEKGCEFFKWESALRRTTSGAAPAVRSSVSLCHPTSSSLHQRPTHRAPLRKSC